MVRFTPPLARLVTLALNARLHREGVVPPTAVGMARVGEPPAAAVSADPLYTRLQDGPAVLTPALGSAYPGQTDSAPVFDSVPARASEEDVDEKTPEDALRTLEAEIDRLEDEGHLVEPGAALTPALESTIRRAAAAKKEQLEVSKATWRWSWSRVVQDALEEKEEEEEALDQAPSPASSLQPSAATGAREALVPESPIYKAAVAAKEKIQKTDRALLRLLSLKTGQTLGEKVPGPMAPIVEHADHRVPFVLPVVDGIVGGSSMIEKLERDIDELGVNLVVLLAPCRWRARGRAEITRAMEDLLYSSTYVKDKWVDGVLDISGAVYNMDTGGVVFSEL